MAVTIQEYNHVWDLVGSKLVHLVNDDFKMMLLTSAFVFDPTHTLLSQISANEIAAGNGYVAGGQSLAALSWAGAPGSPWTWDSDQVEWLANGGPIPAAGNCAHAVIYNNTLAAPADGLFYHINLDGNQSAQDGARFIVRPDALGWKQIISV